MVVKVKQEYIISESVVTSKWDENSKENPDIQTIFGILYPKHLVCGKWTMKGDQITYADYDNNLANYVFSLDPEKI